MRELPRSARDAARRSRFVVDPNGVPGRVLVAVCRARAFLTSWKHHIRPKAQSSVPYCYTRHAIIAHTLAGKGFSLLASVSNATLAFALSLRGARLSQSSRLTALVVALDEAIA